MIYIIILFLFLNRKQTPWRSLFLCFWFGFSLKPASQELGEIEIMGVSLNNPPYRTKNEEVKVEYQAGRAISEYNLYYLNAQDELENIMIKPCYWHWTWQPANFRKYLERRKEGRTTPKITQICNLLPAVSMVIYCGYPRIQRYINISCPNSNVLV